jgi:hypothetical protein
VDGSVSFVVSDMAGSISRLLLWWKATKLLIVKINDVGPLRPGRVLDLNERRRTREQHNAINFVPERIIATQSKSVQSTSWQIDTEMARRLAPLADPFASEDIRVEASLKSRS